MPDGKVLPVASMAGSSSADDGSLVFLGFKMPDGTVFSLAIPHTTAIDLMTLNAAAVGEAARKRTQNPKQSYSFPVEEYRIEVPDPDGSFRIHFVLPGGLDLSFQFPDEGGLRFHEALGSALGVDIPTPPPGTRRN